MSFASRPSPARVTHAAAAKLPRPIPIVLLLLFGIVGLFGRDAWPDDGIALGAIFTTANGSLRDWLLPNILGVPYGADGPLPYWFGALLLRALGPLLGATATLRLTAACWLALATVALWYSTLRLARREEAQPVALAFGGQASPREYGRMLADVALLLFIATLGITLRIHELGVEIPAAAEVSLALYGLAVALDRPVRGAGICGLGIAMFLLTRGPLPALGMLGGCLVAIARTAGRSGNVTTLSGAVTDAIGGPEAPSDAALRGRRPPTARAALVLFVAAALPLAWPLLCRTLFPDADAARFRIDTPFQGASELVSGPASSWGPGLRAPDRGDALWLARNAGWFLWPLWPLAGWALYAWRRVRPAPQIVVPASLAGGLALGALATAPFGEASLAALVPALAVLAAFGSTTLRRGLENLVDWLALAFFSAMALFLWAYFLALLTGSPPRMAASFAHLAPGYKETFRWFDFALAGAATLAWAALTFWRVGLRPAALWRGPLLAAGGTAMLWIVVATLFMPAFDYTQSHRALASEIARAARDLYAAPGGRGLADCLQPHRVPLPLRALIAFDGALRFGRDDRPEACRLALQRDSASTTLDDGPPPGPPGTWKIGWEGHRPARPGDTWRIWVRQPK